MMTSTSQWMAAMLATGSIGAGLTQQGCSPEPDCGDDTVCDSCTGDSDAPSYKVSIAGGYGGGGYPVGATVHVWTDLNPRDQVHIGWQGNSDLLENPLEWHTSFIMPAQDVALSASTVSTAVPLEEMTYTGSTDTPKTVYYHVPEAPVGLIFFLHGTEGNSSFINKVETFTVALTALEQGFAVLGTEAEEAVAGDLDGNGKERWDASLSPDNIDFANLDILMASMRADGLIPPDLPLFAIGMSNGGAFALTLGAVAWDPTLASTFPELEFSAIVSHCASGRTSTAELTQTPSAWYMCGNDTNEEVGEEGNADAEANSQALESRGVPTDFAIHPPQPLYDERFTRIEGIDYDTSRQIATELRQAGFLNDCAYLIQNPDEIVAEVEANPQAFPTVMSLPTSAQKELYNQLKVVFADHNMYSDYTARALRFLLVHR